MLPYGLNRVIAWLPKSGCDVLARNGKAIELNIETRDYEKKFGEEIGKGERQIQRREEA